MEQNKKAIEDQLAKVSSGITEIGSKLDAAEKAGDEAGKAQLMEDLMILDDAAKNLQSAYSQLETQEVQAQESNRAALEEELAKPIYEYKPSSSSFQSYVPVMPPVTPPNPEEKRERNRQIVAELLNQPVGEGGRQAEMLPASLRAQLGSLQTPELRGELLRKNYPDAGIIPLNVGGSTEFLMKMPDGSIKTTFDSGIAGQLSSAAVEIPLTAAQMVAGVGTALATKSPFAGTGASALTRLGLGTAIDESLRRAYGMGGDLGESAGRRGIEAGTELAFGLVTDVAIPAIRSARIPDKFENLFVKTLDEATDRLRKREAALAAKQGREPGVISVPQGARLAGPEGMLMEQELAGEFPGSGLSSTKRQTQETLVRLLDDFTSDVPAKPGDYAAIAVNREGQKRALANSIANATNSNERVIQNALDQLYAGKTSNKVELGEAIRKNVADAENEAIRVRNEAYAPIFQAADQGGFSMTPERLLDEVARMKREIDPSSSMDKSAINAVEARLKARRDAPANLKIAEDQLKDLQAKGEKPSQDFINMIDDLRLQAREMTSADFDSYIKAFNEARPENAVGGTTKDRFGLAISKRLSDLRMKLYDKIQTQLPDGTSVTVGNLFRSATERVGQRRAFEENLLGRILKEAGMEYSATPSDVSDAVLRDPSNVSRVVSALQEMVKTNPDKSAEANQILGLMQDQYLNKIGIGGPNVKPGKTIKIEPEMLDSLYGPNARLVKAGFERINKNAQKLKDFSVSDLTPTDVQRLNGILSEDQSKELLGTIAKRISLEKQQQKLVNSELFRLASRGDFKNIDPDILSKSILSDGTTISQTKKMMSELSKLSPQARNLYKGDFKREILDQFPGGEPTVNAPFTPLFDGAKFIKAWESPRGKSQFALKVETVLGKQDAQFLYDLAKSYDANKIIDASKNPTIRAGFGRGGLFATVTFGLYSKGRNRLIAAALSTGSKRHALKSALARNALPGDVNKAYNEMFKEAFLTRTGITALAHQASQDPEFSAELTNMAKEFRKQQGLDIPEFAPKPSMNE
jgi:hypothetical protein